MPIKEYWNFADEGSVPAEFTEVEGGSGAVSITSNHLRIDIGGTASTDYAAAVFKTALDQSKLTIVYGECKFSGVTGAFGPNLVGLVNSSGEPVASTQANFDKRCWWDYQISSGADNFDRVVPKVKNSSGTEVNWRQLDDPAIWSLTFGNYRAFFDEGSYYRFVLIFDGTTSPKQVRLLVYGSTETNDNRTGWALSFDTLWNIEGTGTTEMDAIDDDLWVVFGDLSNDQTKSAIVIYDFRRIMIAEMDTSVRAEFGFTNYSVERDVTQQREIQKYLNPMPDTQTLWIPREPYDWESNVHNPFIARGSNHDVKDPFCFYDGTTWWVFYRQNDGAGNIDIYVDSFTDVLNGSLGGATLISAAAAGETAHEFPWVTKQAGTWYMIFSVEFDSPKEWKIYYRTTTAASPTSGWSSKTLLLDTTGSGAFDDDGCNSPTLVWHSGSFTGGKWYMLYAGNSGAIWKGGMAESTDGILGTWSRVTAPLRLNIGSIDTQIDGAMTDVSQLTVDSTTGMNVGELLYIVESLHVFEILSIDSGTTLTVQIETTKNDNAAVRSYTRHSISPRQARRSNGFWFIYIVAFKGPGVNEATSIYVDTTGNLDLETCTFREMREGDSGIDLVLPPVAMVGSDPIDVLLSDENLTWVTEALTGPVFAGADMKSYPRGVQRGVIRGAA